MNKLQLYITINYEGFKPMTDINAEDEVRRYVSDLSTALDDIEYDPHNKEIFYLLKSTGQGTFIIALRTIPERKPNHLAAWIFVPACITINDEDIAEAVNAVTGVIGNSRITSDEQAHLREVFSKEYETLLSYGATIENFGMSYAHRFYGGDTGFTLLDFIGNKRYQTSYLPYAGVLLVDKSITSSVVGKDLTDEPLEQMVKIFPPKLEDSSYRPLIFSRPFDRPFLVPLMGTVEIVWESSTAVDIRQSIMISKPNMRPDSVSAMTQRSVRQEKASVYTTTPTPIIIDGKKEPAAPEKEKDTAQKTVPAQPSVVTETEVHTHSTDPRIISHDRMHTYNFEIPAKSAAISGMIRFEINTRTPLTDSPIDGYELSDAISEGASRSNHLIYAPTGSLNTKLIWAAAGFVVGILLTLLCTCSWGASSSADGSLSADSLSTDTVSVASVAADAAGADNQEHKDSTFEGAIRYLDTNQKWTKTDLESYPDLKGLYDDMNNLKRQRLIEHWYPKLKDSRTFAKIKEHCQNGLRKAPKLKEGQKTFNVGSDQTISVRSYLNTIDP